MGKSRKKSPVVNPGSDKWFKQHSNRKLRSRVNQIMRTYPERDILPILREISNIYVSNKDGGYALWNDKYEHLGRLGFFNHSIMPMTKYDWNECLAYHPASGTYKQYLAEYYSWQRPQETPEEEYAKRLERYKKALRK